MTLSLQEYEDNPLVRERMLDGYVSAHVLRAGEGKAQDEKVCVRVYVCMFVCSCVCV